MRYGRQFLQDAALGEWIRKNPTKSFAMATLEGVTGYKPTFTSHEEINAEREKEEKFKMQFFYDEAADINPDVLNLLSQSKAPITEPGGE